jgi:hypothetical protein
MKTTTLTADMAKAMKKDLAGITARWITAGRVASEELRDAAVAEFKAYVDMLAGFGISLADIDNLAA